MKRSQAGPMMAGVFVVMLLLAPPVRGQPPTSGPSGEDEKQASDKLPGDRPLAPEGLAALEDLPNQTPADKIRSAALLMNFGQFERARNLVDQLASSVTSDQAMAALQQAVGTPVLFRLSADSRLSSDQRRWLINVLESAKRALRDPGRLGRLAADLATATSAGEVRRALEGLAPGGPDAAVALIERLAGERDATARQRLVAGLAALGQDALEPSAAVLVSSHDSGLILSLLQALEQANQRQAQGYLLRWAAGRAPSSEVADAARRLVAAWSDHVPTPPVAQQRLVQLARTQLAGPRPGRHAQRMWMWNEADRRMAGRSMSPREAALVRAMRWAADAHQLAPDDPGTTVVYLASRLAVDQQLGSLDRPLRTGPGTAHEAALVAERPLIERVLQLGLASDQTAAAIAACQILADQGDAGAVYGHGQQPSVLVEALRSGHRRVQFAAADAVARLHVETGYNGASIWDQTARFLATSEGRRRVLVCDPSPSRATQLAGLAQQLGWTPTVCPSPDRLRQFAGRSADYEAILLGTPWLGVRVEQVVEQVRQDPRIADLPLAVVTLDRSSQAPRWGVLQAVEPWTLVLAEPTDLPSMAACLARLAQLAPRFAVPAERRLQQADAARRWLAASGGGPPGRAAPTRESEPAP